MVKEKVVRCYAGLLPNLARLISALMQYTVAREARDRDSVMFWMIQAHHAKLCFHFRATLSSKPILPCWWSHELCDGLEIFKLQFLRPVL